MDASSNISSIAPPASVGASEAAVKAFSPVSLAWFLGLLCLLFAPVLWGMAQEWINDDDMSHGIFVPAVAGWVAWQERSKWAHKPARGTNWGLALLLLGVAQLLAGTLGAEFFIARTGFLVSLVGVILFLGGWPILRGLAFPLFLLLFMIRIPAIVYNQITFPLQLFASRCAEIALSLMGIPVLREGNILELASQKLSVVEACSGIRSLLSLSFFSLIYAYVFDSKIWMRGVLLVATIPIAVAANALRVTLTGVLSETKKELAEGFFHTAEGWVIFLVAVVILMIAHQVINRIHGALKA